MQVIPVDLYEDLENLDPQTKKVIVKLIKYMGEIVRRDDFLELKEEVNKLTKIIAELAEAQRRTEQKFAELAEAQRRTEEGLRKLILDHRKTREQLGSLAHTFGYFLENEAYKHLPKLLQRDFGLEIEKRLLRDYIEIAPNKYEEINIYGKGTIRGKPIIILGEVKSQFKKSDIDNFLKKVEKLQKILPEDKILILVTHQTSPQIKNYAQSKGLKIYFSYEFA
uniref:Chordopoxvirus fusion protein n=1 Tax=Thermodesulfobacterium geofontis TaxID=1295609 RepID=A0A7C4JQS5_9BACT